MARRTIVTNGFYTHEQLGRHRPARYQRRMTFGDRLAIVLLFAALVLGLLVLVVVVVATGYLTIHALDHVGGAFW